MSLITSKIRKARKEYVCSFCGCKIAKGEKYSITVNCHEGSVYNWRAHCHCQDLCDKLWDFADPDEGGMDSDALFTAVRHAMSVFYCPFFCPQYDSELRSCNDYFDEDECIRAFAKFMEGKKLTVILGDDGFLCWKLTEEKKDEPGQ